MTWKDFVPPILLKAFTYSRISGLFALHGPYWSATTDYATMVREGFQNAVVYACVMGIARPAGGVPWTLTQQATSRGGKPQPVPDDHAAWKVLRRPNPLMGEGAFREAMVGFYELSGNLFLTRASTQERGKEQPQELYLLIPDQKRYEPLYDSQQQRVGYAYTSYGSGGNPLPPRIYALNTLPVGTAIWYRGNQYGSDNYGQLLHVRHFTPDESWYGLAPLLAAAHSVDNVNAALRWNTALLQQSCRPPLVLQSEHTLDPPMKQILREQINEMFSGAEGAGKPMLLDGGLTANKIGLTPTEMDYLEGKTDAGLDICRAYNYPPELAGFDKKYSNYETARKALYTECVFPVLELLAAELTHWLLPLYGDGLILGIDRDSVDAIREERVSLFKDLNNAWWLTLNQRLQLVGMEPVGPVGDRHFIPNNLVPLDMGGTAPASVLPEGALQRPAGVGQNGHAHVMPS